MHWKDVNKKESLSITTVVSMEIGVIWAKKPSQLKCNHYKCSVNVQLGIYTFSSNCVISDSLHQKGVVLSGQLRQGM